MNTALTNLWWLQAHNQILTFRKIKTSHNITFDHLCIIINYQTVYASIIPCVCLGYQSWLYPALWTLWMQLLCETETSVHLSCITNEFIAPVLTAGSTLRAISRRSMLWTKCITLIRYEKWHLKSVIVASAESTGYNKPGVLGSIPGDCCPFHFSSQNIYVNSCWFWWKKKKTWNVSYSK